MNDEESPKCELCQRALEWCCWSWRKSNNGASSRIRSNEPFEADPSHELTIQLHRTRE